MIVLLNTNRGEGKYRYRHVHNKDGFAVEICFGTNQLLIATGQSADLWVNLCNRGLSQAANHKQITLSK
jgi:hypothetical protein